MRFPCLGDAQVQSLRTATDIAQLRQACVYLIHDSPYVRVQPDRLSVLEAYLPGARPPAWTAIFDPRSTTDADRLFDAALNASLNGGYFFQDATGQVRQWAAQGSGSQALLDWFADLRSQGLVPGHDGHGGDAWRHRIRATLVGQPYLDERLQVLEQFQDPARRARLDGLAAEVCTGLAVDLAHVDRLADIYPAGLRADPLRKKAILAFVLLAGNMAARGRSVRWAAGIPADYQLPRGCVWKGVLRLSEDVLIALRSPDHLLSIHSAPVYHLRAATLVVVEELSARTGTPGHIVDEALFMGFRRDPAFWADAPPPIRVDGTWF